MGSGPVAIVACDVFPDVVASFTSLPLRMWATVLEATSRIRISKSVFQTSWFTYDGLMSSREICALGFSSRARSFTTSWFGIVLFCQ